MDQRGTYRICIPPRFFQNHSERDSPPLGKIIERTKRGVVIECNKAEMEEWLSQAQIYSTCAGSTIGGIPVAHHNLGLLSRQLKILSGPKTAPVNLKANQGSPTGSGTAS